MAAACRRGRTSMRPWARPRPAQAQPGRGRCPGAASASGAGAAWRERGLAHDGSRPGGRAALGDPAARPRRDLGSGAARPRPWQRPAGASAASAPAARARPRPRRRGSGGAGAAPAPAGPGTARGPGAASAPGAGVASAAWAPMFASLLGTGRICTHVFRTAAVRVALLQDGSDLIFMCAIVRVSIHEQWSTRVSTKWIDFSPSYP